MTDEENRREFPCSSKVRGRMPLKILSSANRRPLRVTINGPGRTIRPPTPIYEVHQSLRLWRHGLRAQPAGPNGNRTQAARAGGVEYRGALLRRVSLRSASG